MDSSKDYLVNELGKVFDNVNEVIDKMPDDIFELNNGDKWSPKQNLVHLLQSTKPVIDALNMPKATFLIYGKSKSGSKSYDEVVSTYLTALGDGVTLTGKFAPSEKMISKTKNELLDYWNNSNPSLVQALENWSEENLDKYRIPHPLIGNMTFREMLHFMIYHTGHHLRTISNCS